MLAEIYSSVFAFQNAIANASSLAEVERLKGMLQAGQIPGRDLRQGQCRPNTIPQLILSSLVCFEAVSF